MKRLMILAVFCALGSTSATAQVQRPCLDYLNGREVAAILSEPSEALPPQGQYSRDGKLEWHVCDWRNRTKKLALSVQLQRWSSEAEMRASQLTPRELGPKVQIEKKPRLGELGATFVNQSLGTVVATASKGTRVVSVTLEAQPGQIPDGSKQQLERLAEKLWTKL